MLFMPSTPMFCAISSAAVVRVHHIQRHLYGVEGEVVFTRELEGMQVNARIFVAGEADVADLAGPLRLDQRSVRALLIEDAVRVLVADHLVMLHQIDGVDTETPERFVELTRRLTLRAAVDLGHQKRLAAIAVAERLAHADLAGALVVVPTVVEEIDAAIEGRADDADAGALVQLRETDVPPAKANRRDALASSSERPIGHLTVSACWHGYSPADDDVLFITG
jgi:hypothetical protein